MAEPSKPHRRLTGLKPQELMARGFSQETKPVLDVEGIEIEAPLGRGGMGAVFLGRQVSLDREVAVKILASELADDPLFLERLEREARVMARLRHPNIVAVHDFQRSDASGAAIVMDFIEGGSLRDQLRRHPRGLPVAEALRIIRQIAAGLRAAHEAGIVHRDMKPENVLIQRDGSVCVTDFGLALPMKDGSARLTLTGAMMGTADYMPPEQIRGEEADARSDIFALGVILYELLTGQTPRGSFDEPRRVRPEISAALSKAVMRALRPVASDRYANVSEFLAALDNSEARAGRRRLVFAAAGILAAAGVTAWLWSRKQEMPAPIETHGPWHDGLAGVRIRDDIIAGDWTKGANGALTSDGSISIVALERDLPAAYDVRARFTRLGGRHSVAVFIRANGSMASCELDAWQEGLAGLQMIDGKSLLDGYGFRFALENGRACELLIEVRPESVRMSVDGEFKKEFPIAGKTLGVTQPWGWLPGPERIALAIGSYQSPARFDLVEWRAVEVRAKPTAP